MSWFDLLISWLGQYWWVCLIGIAAAMKVLNKITVHFSEHKGLVRWCLFLIDLLDVIKTTPAPAHHRRGSSIKVGPTLLALAVLLLAGCAPIFSGKLADAHRVGFSRRVQATLQVFHAECKARAKECAAGGVKRALDCAPWRACDNARAGMLAAVRLVEEGLLAVDQAAKQATAAGVLP